MVLNGFCKWTRDRGENKVRTQFVGAITPSKLYRLQAA